VSARGNLEGDVTKADRKGARDRSLYYLMSRWLEVDFAPELYETRGYHDVLPSDYCTTARVNGFKVRYERGAWKSLEFEACHKGFAGNAQRGGRYGIFPRFGTRHPPSQWGGHSDSVELWNSHAEELLSAVRSRKTSTCQVAISLICA